MGGRKSLSLHLERLTFALQHYVDDAAARHRLRFLGVGRNLKRGRVELRLGRHRQRPVNDHDLAGRIRRQRLALHASGRRRIAASGPYGVALKVVSRRATVEGDYDEAITSRE